MAFQSTDTSNPISYSGNDQTWVIKTGVVVAPDSQVAVTEFYDGGSLLNQGSIVAAASRAAILVTGDRMHIVNAAGGYITGSIGVYSVGGNGTHASSRDYLTTVDNDGTISGQNGGLFTYGAFSVNNEGRIYGHDFGVTASAGGSLHNLADGIISSGITAVGGIGTIINEGRIESDQYAVIADELHVRNAGTMVGDIVANEAGDSAVHNTGEIDGTLTFAAGTDRYDGRHGTISGTVFGNGGDDTLLGGAGDEVFSGGLGADHLDGRGGSDTFVYDSDLESTVARSDRITHWDASDLLDLAAIDANSKKKGIQDFTFAGQVDANAPLTPHAVAFYHTGGDTFVVADVTGDGKADLQIVLHGEQTLVADNFAF